MLSRVLFLLLGVLLAWAIAVNAGLIAMPNERDDCRLMFIEVDLGEELAAYQVYAPLYVCARGVEA